MAVPKRKQSKARGRKRRTHWKAKDNICVSKTFLRQGKQKFSNIVNEFTKYDPTLPRVKNVPCPNENCAEDPEKEIIYIRYDDNNMKYVYLCGACDTIWTI